MEERDRRLKKKNRGKKIMFIGIGGFVVGVLVRGPKPILGAIICTISLVIAVVGGIIVTINTDQTDLK